MYCGFLQGLPSNEYFNGRKRIPVTQHKCTTIMKDSFPYLVLLKAKKNFVHNLKLLLLREWKNYAQANVQ